MIDERVADLISVTSGDVWKLVSLEWKNEEESHGLHHIYVRALNEDGERLVRVPVSFRAGNDPVNVGYTEAKPLSEWGDVNWGMYRPMGEGCGPYSVWVSADSSDVVSCMGLGTPEKPWETTHTSFVLTFQRGAEPEPEPPPTPEPGLKEQLLEQLACIEEYLDAAREELSRLKTAIEENL